MRLLKLRGNDSNNFAEAPEIAMDFHLGRSSDNEHYAVVLPCGHTTKRGHIHRPAERLFGREMVAPRYFGERAGRGVRRMAGRSAYSAAIDDSDYRAGLAIILERDEPGDSNRHIASRSL